MLRRSTGRALVAALATLLLWLPAGPAASDKGGGGHDDDKPPTPTTTCAPAGSFRVGTHNVLHGAATFTRFAGVIGWQEVSDPADRRKLRSQLGTGYGHYISRDGSAAAVPVSWRAATFRLLKAYSVKTHEGRLNVSPDRWITVVHLQRRDTGRRFVVLNTHFVSEAFKSGSSHRAWRLSRWYDHHTKLKRVLANLRGTYPHRGIFLVGDFNHHGYLDYSAKRVYPVRAEHGTPIDQIYAGVPGRGDCLEKLSTVGSDHTRWRAAAWFG